MMTKKVCARSLIVLLFAVCLTCIASAQTNWVRTFGGIRSEEGHSVQPTSDGGYIVAGSTLSFGPGTPEGQNVYLIKTDSLGDTLWTRVYGWLGVDVGRSVRQTTDGGYIVAGYTTSFGAGYDDVYLIKTDSSGDTLWTRTYGGTNAERGEATRLTADGGYIIAGYTFSFGPGTPDSANVYLVRTNAQGDTLWTRSLGGRSDDEGNSVAQTADSGFVIAGTTYSFGPGSGDFYLVKTNALGDTLWTRTYGGGAYPEWGTSVQQCSDGGYVITGGTYSFGPGSGDVYLVKTNALGDTLWTRTYGGGTDPEWGTSVQQCSDGGYVIAGTTYSFGPGGGDVYLIKTDSLGDTLWTRVYGGTGVDVGTSVQQTTDGGYIVAGYTASFGAGGYDVYLIKTDSLGNAAGIEEPLTRHPARPTHFLVQPNPVTSFARVPGHETDVFSLSDVAGRQVAICKGDRVGEGLRPGVYFLSPVGSKTSKAVTATIVKMAL
jgi:hypothetical protein